MKFVLIVVLMVNWQEMEIVSDTYPSKEECEKQIPVIREDVKSINKNAFPLEVVSAICMESKQ